MLLCEQFLPCSISTLQLQAPAEAPCGCLQLQPPHGCLDVERSLGIPRHVWVQVVQAAKCSLGIPRHVDPVLLGMRGLPWMKACGCKSEQDST